MILVAELILDFVLVGLAMIQSVWPAEKILLDGHDLPNGAVVDPLDGFSIARMKSALKTGHHAQILCLGQCAGSGDFADADRVDSMGFLDENVLAGFDRRVEIHGMIF